MNIVVICCCWCWIDVNGWSSWSGCCRTRSLIGIASSRRSDTKNGICLTATALNDNGDDTMSNSGSDTVLVAEKNKCSYNNLAINRWRPRKLLDDLKVGDALPDCYKTQELFDAKTGPKLFFECGIGRMDGKGKWQMVSGMLRLNEVYSYSKKSVIRKKAKKAFDKNRPITLYVSKALKDHGRLEVSIDNPKHLKIPTKKKKLLSASKLKVGYEMEGTVVSVKPYGVFVDVGANRLGLLHIQTVADLYGHYIAKEKGLINAGLEPNARIRVAVQKNDRKRLALGFPSDVKQTEEQPTANNDLENTSSTLNTESTTTTISVQTNDDKNMDNDDNDEDDEDDEAAMWAAYAADEYGDYEDDHYDDDEDEERDIEDSLGLGTY